MPPSIPQSMRRLHSQRNQQAKLLDGVELIILLSKSKPIKVYAWGEGDDVKQPLKTSKPKKEIVNECHSPILLDCC